MQAKEVNNPEKSLWNKMELSFQSRHFGSFSTPMLTLLTRVSSGKLRLLCSRSGRSHGMLPAPTRAAAKETMGNYEKLCDIVGKRGQLLISNRIVHASMSIHFLHFTCKSIFWAIYEMKLKFSFIPGYFA